MDALPQPIAILAQTALERNIVLWTLLAALASIPVALTVSFYASRKTRGLPPPLPAAPEAAEEPPNPDTPPPLPGPPPLPPAEETGVPARQWRAVDGWAALGLTVLLCLMMGPAAASPAEGEPAAAEAPSLSAKALGMNLVFQLSLAGILLSYLSMFRGFNLSELFGLKRLRPMNVLTTGVAWGAAGGFAVLVVTAMLLLPLMKLIGVNDPEPQQMVRALAEQPPDAQTQLMVFLTAVIGAPLMEELIFRGFLYGTAKRFTGAGYAAVLSSVLFGVIHANFMSLIPLTLLGLLFVYVYEKTRSLPVVMVMHGLFNLAQLCLLFYGRGLAKTS